MATGAHHYQAAERLIANAERLLNEGTPNTHEERTRGGGLLLDAAQVHATLALAAATIEPTIVTFGRGAGNDDRVLIEWSEAVSG